MSSQHAAPIHDADASAPDRLLAPALEAVRAGALLALDPGEELRIDTKRDRNDVVTQIDRGVEALIAERLAPTGYPLLGEEGHTVDSWRGRVWVLDPIDGTLNYVAVHRHWAISLALVEDGAPVLGIVADPVDDRLYTAVAGRGARTGRLFDESGVGGRPLPLIQDATVADGVVIAHVHALACLGHLPEIVRSSRGLRCYGAAALELVEVAAGRAGSLVHPRLQPWDGMQASFRSDQVEPGQEGIPGRNASRHDGVAGIIGCHPQFGDGRPDLLHGDAMWRLRNGRWGRPG